MMDDEPCCSKSWREPPPSSPEQPERAADSPVEEDEGDEWEPSRWQKDTPSTVLREVGDVLPLAEVKNARLVCKNWTSCLDAAFLQKSRRQAVNATSYQWEPIHYAHALYAPQIKPRMFACGAHHPMTEKIYMFGGNGPEHNMDNYDFDAQYNDVWTYDMRLKCWDRLFVRGTPYPSSKSRSSLVAWRDYLVLFGGFRRPNRRRVGMGAAEYPERMDDGDSDDPTLDLSGPDRGSHPAEVHYLNVKKNVWETATPVPREGCAPAFGLHDHGTAVIGDRWMVVVGGVRSTPWDETVFLNSQVVLFDLEERCWHRAPMLPDTLEEKLNRPRAAECARGTLTLIRPGRLLYHPAFPIRYPPFHPQQPRRRAVQWPPHRPHILPIQALLARQRDALNAYLLDYNPADVLGELWRWSAVPVVSPHLLKVTGPLASPVAVRCEDRVQLVCVVAETRRVRHDADLDVFNGLQSFAASIRREIRTRLAASATPAAFYDSLIRSPFEFELDAAALYKHTDTTETCPNALKLIVSVLQGSSGRIGDYKVRVRVLNARYRHAISQAALNFAEETTVGQLPITARPDAESGEYKRSPHAAAAERTLQQVRQSARRVIKILKADLTALDAQQLEPQLVWEETAERPAHEEQPAPSTGLLLVQADGTLLVTGGQGRPDEEGLVDTGIGGGTWVANPVK